MKTNLTALLLLCTFPLFSQTNSYQQGWQFLNNNDRVGAETAFKKAMNDPATKQDAYMANLYLQTYNGKVKSVEDFNKSFYTVSENPYPYIFALWFNNAVLGDYGKKKFDYQLSLADALMKDDKAPGTLNAAASYQKGMHLLFSNDLSKAINAYDQVKNLKNWQYVGVFENISESGIYKNYGPYEHPEAEAVFTSVSNAPVKWFTPPTENNDGWTPFTYQFPVRTGVTYAQTFVESDKDQEMLLNAGFTGAIKVWINDEPVLIDTKERTTEMDAISVPYVLKKGFNRVLVQLAFTDKGYPNFCVRLTDKMYKPLAGIKSVSEYKNYPKGINKTPPAVVPHFAEAYFNSKIEKDKNNLLNYMLLSDTYMRDFKVLEARNTLTDALAIAPDNSLIRMKLLEVLIKEGNRTQMLEELEKIKQDDPLCITVLDIKIKELFDNEKFEDGAAEMKKRISLHGEDESTDGYNVLLLVNEKKYDELVKEGERLFKKYPDNARFLEMMYNIKKDVYKDKKGAVKVYENYMRDNFNYQVYENYAALQNEQGNTKKALEIKQDLAKSFPFNPYGYDVLSKYHFGIKQFEKAEEYARKSLQLAPYYESFWEQLGDIKNEVNKKTEAMEAYVEALKFNPKQYDIISKIRKLNGQPEVRKLFVETDVEQAIKNDKPADAKNTDYGYYYILDEKNVVLYPGGAAEEFISVAIKITNDKGVDRYKESSIGYSGSQNLLIEKAEIIKKNNAHLQGERNGNEIVFTNLEIGDVVIFRYRLQNFSTGRFSKDFWDKYYFTSEIYTGITRYNILVPDNETIFYDLTNGSLKPKESKIENFRQYSWELLKGEPVKYEPLMPLINDIGSILHISTIKNWNDIANWYADVSNNKADEDFEIVALYKKLFPDPAKKLTQYEKARTIYNYLENNIRYSSVSFRQSAYVPQRPSSTLNTRLGDCKDLSSLFVTLTQMAGINSQLVLVNTRDNGEKDMMLPSIEFNHCIAKAKLDNKDYYIELTDNYLPFASLPNNLNGASILEIPYRVSSTDSRLSSLKAANRTKDVIRREMEIKPEGSDLSMKVKVIRYGNASSSSRDAYGHLDEERKMQELEKSVAGGYKNNVKLTKVVFFGLDKIDDSISYVYDFKVKNEIAEIGSMSTFRIVYPDVIASLDNFSADTRSFPIEYWTYEDVDQYETVVTITAPAGKKFVELPTSETLTFRNLKFTLQYTLKSPDKLIVTRKFNGDRQNIAAEDYVAFRDFFEKIVKAEQKFIAYK